MKHFLYGLMVAVGLTACSSTSPIQESQSSTKSTISWYEVKPPSNDLLGRWLFPDNGCNEHYHYHANGKFTTTSFQEQLEGHFSVEPITGHRATLKIRRTVDKDNKKTDCQGSRTDSTGVETVRYLVFESFKRRMYVCADASGSSCFGPLLRY